MVVRFLLRIIFLSVLLSASLQAEETVFISRAHGYGISQFDAVSQVEGVTNPVSCAAQSLAYVDDGPLLFGVDQCGSLFSLNTFTDDLTVMQSGFVNFGVPGQVVAVPSGGTLFATKYDADILQIDVASGAKTSHPVGTAIAILGVSNGGQSVYFIDFVDKKIRSFDTAAAQVADLADVPNSPQSSGAVDPHGRFLLFSSQEIPSAAGSSSYYDVFLHRVDLQSLAVDTFQLVDGFEAKQVSVSPSGNKAYVLVADGIRAVDLSGPAMTQANGLSRSTLGAFDVASTGTIWAIDDVLPYQVVTWNPSTGASSTIPISTGTQVANLYDVVIAERPACYDPVDTDGDGVGDTCDNCPAEPNADQRNVDNDPMGDVCDLDIDNDTILNPVDNCVYHANTNQSDIDGDGIGDVCEIFDRHALKRFLDVRLQALAEILQDAGIDGPWGPWPPLPDCRPPCNELTSFKDEYALGLKYANDYLGSRFSGGEFTEDDVLAVLGSDGRVSPDMIKAYVMDRTGEKEPTKSYWIPLILVAAILILAILMIRRRP